MPTPAEVFPAALSAALCDMVAIQLIEFQTLLGVLGSKGHLTIAEWNQAKSTIPPARIADLTQKLHTQLQERIAARTQEMVNIPPGNVH